MNDQAYERSVIDNVADKLISLPDQTELSIAIARNKSTIFVGLLKENGIIKQVGNSNAAFEIGSITKLFTANILSQLVIEGIVKQDDLIEKHLPFKLKHRPPITLQH